MDNRGFGIVEIMMILLIIFTLALRGELTVLASFLLPGIMQEGAEWTKRRYAC